MSAYLKTLKSFQVISNVTNDDVLDHGEIIPHTSKVDLLAAKPDRLRVEVTSDDRHRLYLYDGKDFTVWPLLVNYYATVRYLARDDRPAASVRRTTRSTTSISLCFIFP